MRPGGHGEHGRSGVESIMSGFHLGPWLVQPSLNALEREGEVVRLEPKVMALLECLAEAEGDVVSKDELMARVWDDGFVSDEVLTTSIYALRRALGDEARNPRFVETIRKRGYRLVMTVRPLLVASPSPPSTAGVDAKVGGPRVPWGRLRVAGVLVATALAGAWLGAMTQRTPVETTTEVPVERDVTPRAIRSLAVLPLEGLTEECRQDYFADTLTDMLITDLVDLGRMEVLPGLSTRVFGRRPDLEALSSLPADAVVEGSVIRSGDRLWVSVQLVDTVTGHMLWGGSYEREGDDAIALQRDVALDIARRIHEATTGGVPAVPTVAPIAEALQ